MRYAARVGMVLAVVLAGIVLPGSAAQACSCALGTPEQQARIADAVFTGEIVKREPSKPVMVGPLGPATKAYTVVVDAVFKGEVPTRVEVVAGGSEASCGVSFPTSGSVLMFADQARDQRGTDLTRFSTHLCTGSRMIDGEVPASLGVGASPIGAGSAFHSSLTITEDDDAGWQAAPYAVAAAVLVASIGTALGVLWWRRHPGSNT